MTLSAHSQKLLKLSIKIVIAAVLIYILVHSGKLNFEKISIIWSQPSLLLITVLGWLAIPIGVGSFRWWILMKGLGFELTYRRALQLTFVGFFFNTAMPGAVGGDLIKAFYAYKDEPEQGKTRAMLSILIDRIIGLQGLFFLGFIGVNVNFAAMYQLHALHPIILILWGVFLATLGLFWLLFRPSPSGKDRVLQWLSLPYKGLATLRKIYVAIVAYKRCPQVIMQAFVLSVINQACIMGYFLNLAIILNNQPIEVTQFAAVFPIACLVTSLPIAPSGLGVGHIAFERLLAMIGVNQGANIFNIYIIASIILSLTGAIPYLFLRKTSHDRIDHESQETKLAST